jgi:hypothetical protein
VYQELALDNKHKLATHINRKLAGPDLPELLCPDLLKTNLTHMWQQTQRI